MEDNYQFKMMELNQQEFERTSDLLRLVFPRASYLTPRYLEWQYAENPDGQVVACHAILDGMLVGHVSALPMRAVVDGATLRGMFMLNSAVHPGHRRRNLMRRVSEAVFEEGVMRGYAFCVSTGNRYSTLPLLTRFKMVRPLEARIGFGLPVRRDLDFVPSFERLWSEEAMRWRLSNPERPYSVGSRQDDVVVISPAGLPSIGAVLYDGANSWGLSNQDAESPGPLRLWLGVDPAIDWRRSSFVPIPTRLRPSPLNLVFKDLSGGSLHPDAARFIFRAIDFDPY